MPERAAYAVPSRTVQAVRGERESTRPRRHRLWHELAPLLRVLSATVVIGAATGAVIGGLGGRLVMRILFLTSDESVKGITSDDGFEIGRFTLFSTLGLVLLCALLGVIAALCYLVARPFLVALGAAVVPAMAALYGAVGGSLLVHRDGIDFNVLEPVTLAIVLFVLLCAGFGAFVAWAVNAAATEWRWPRSASWFLLAPPLLLVLLPPFVLVAIPAVVCNWLAERAGTGNQAWRALQGIAVVTMAALFTLGVVDLARDTAGLT
jgi:hypothetical protein